MKAKRFDRRRAPFREEQQEKINWLESIELLYGGICDVHHSPRIIDVLPQNVPNFSIQNGFLVFSAIYSLSLRFDIQ